MKLAGQPFARSLHSSGVKKCTGIFLNGIMILVAVYLRFMYLAEDYLTFCISSVFLRDIGGSLHEA